MGTLMKGQLPSSLHQEERAPACIPPPNPILPLGQACHPFHLVHPAQQGPADREKAFLNAVLSLEV